MRANEPSQSMIYAARCRAAHQLLDRPPIFEDPVAVGLISEASEAGVLAAVDEQCAPFSTLLRSLFALRSRFVEERLAEAVVRGVPQYVVVGAGLDTFAWRQPAYARAIRIFYVDHSCSLGWAIAQFRRRGLETPSNLSFVAADLEAQELATMLVEQGFQREAGAFCSVPVVTQYLSREAVEALLHFAASLPTRSEIVFSFVPPDDELEGEELAAAIQSVKLTETMGEPWATRLRPSEAFDLLAHFGFGEVFHLTPESAQKRYFAGRDDRFRAPCFEQLIAAIK
jgi:methyltransferase (TIGR00027 family)